MGDRGKLLYPILMLILGAVVAGIIILARPAVERRQVPAAPILVRALEVHRSDIPLNVRSQGTVRPRTASVLVAQVSGRVESVAPSFAEGGFFREGEVLVRIDPRDYELEVARAEADVARARVRLEPERAEAEVARQEWEELGKGEPSPLTLREPQLAEARANLQGAQAAFEKARLELARTRISAPYDGRVSDKLVDIGQFVAPGARLAELYATNVAEVRLPIARGDLAYLDINLGHAGPGTDGPEVILQGELGGSVRRWSGRVVRTDSAFDPKTRMLDVFVQVDDPFGRRQRTDDPPLPMGLFVEAEVRGRLARQAIALPRAALRGEEQVLVVDGDSRLRFRSVQIIRRTGERVIVGDGLQEGEVVCISPLETVVDGMRVRVARDDEPADPTRALESDS